MKNPDFLSFTLKFLRTYGGKSPGISSYEPLDTIHEGKWSYFDSERWNFAVDYIGKNHITNIGIVRKPKLGTGLLYVSGDRNIIKLITFLDHHRWRLY